MIKPISQSSKKTAVEAMREAGVAFASIPLSRRQLSSLCRDAINMRGPVILLDADGNGVGLALIGAPVYLRYFLVRHPVFACRVVLRRIAKPAFPQSRTFAYIEGDKSALSIPWNTTSPTVARVVLVSVNGRARKRGLGTALIDALFVHLRQQGVSTVLAQVGEANEPSLALCRKTGWILGRQGGQWRALRMLE